MKIRPSRLPNKSDVSIANVGFIVDAWLHDGWCEGIVVHKESDDKIHGKTKITYGVQGFEIFRRMVEKLVETNEYQTRSGLLEATLKVIFPTNAATFFTFSLDSSSSSPLPPTGKIVTIQKFIHLIEQFRRRSVVLETQLAQYNYILVVGEEEINSKQVKELIDAAGYYV
ncbi:hypothetical protein Tco_0366457 [Tanacetum coccineum]